MIKSPVKVRVFSDTPIDMNIIWMVIAVLLALLSAFLGYKAYSQKCPDVICPEFNKEPCPSCNLDCSTCPEKIAYRDIIKNNTRYVCQNMDVVENPDDCVKKIKKYDISLVTTNEDNTFIQSTKVNAACVNGLNGGEVYYSVATTPDEVAIEIKEVGVDQKFREFKTFPGLLTKYRYFTICDPNEGDCKTTSDFYLEKHKIYILRIKFDETSTTKRIEYSNEHLIDTTSDSDYILKKCR